MILIPEISIELPSNYDVRIIDLLESLRIQTFQDYEIIVATYSPALEDLVKNYDVRVVRTIDSGTLFRRIEAHRLARGERIFLLEASRFLNKDCLLEIDRCNNDMIVMEERDVNNNFIAKIQNIERSSAADKLPRISPEQLIVEPRVFSKHILDEVFRKAKLINEQILKKIYFGDLDIIFYEAYNMSQNIGLINRPLVYHYTDENILEFIRKYYNYGRSNKYLRFTPYKGKFKARSHLRPSFGFAETFAIYSLWLVKAMSFAVGQYM